MSERPNHYAARPVYPKIQAELDPGIREVVRILREGGVDTFESCEGGPGHASPEPMVRFNGAPSDGFHAYAVVADGKYGLRVRNLRRIWQIESGELAGPFWEITFHPDSLPVSS